MGVGKGKPAAVWLVLGLAVMAAVNIVSILVLIVVSLIQSVH